MGEIARPVLGIGGYLIGGPVGFMVGSVLGGALFPPGARGGPTDVAGQKISGPAPGTPLPILYGTDKPRGHPAWVGPLKTIRGGGKKGGGGGAGKGKAGGTQDTYVRSFVHAICEGGDEVRLLKIWQGDDLLYDVADPAVLAKSKIDFTFYQGTLTQAVDPRMTAYQAGGVDLSRYVSETFTLNGGGRIKFTESFTASPYTVLRPAVTASSDSVVAVSDTESSGIVRTPLTRVGGAPSAGEYSINITTGEITVGAGSGYSFEVTYTTSGNPECQESFSGVSYTVQHPTVQSSSDRVFTVSVDADGHQVVTYLTRVGGTPGLGQYSIDTTSGVITIGNPGGNYVVQYRTTKALSAVLATYVVKQPPVVSGSDSVTYPGSDVGEYGNPTSVVALTRVGSNPGPNEYAIDIATGTLTFGQGWPSTPLTITYRVGTSQSAQAALRYPGVCYIYFHEFPLGATQLTYEVARIVGQPVAVEQKGVTGWTYKVTGQIPTSSPNRFFKLHETTGVFSDLGFWAHGLDTLRYAYVTDLIRHESDAYWYVGAAQDRTTEPKAAAAYILRWDTVPGPNLFSASKYFERNTNTGTGTRATVWDITILGGVPYAVFDTTMDVAGNRPGLAIGDGVYYGTDIAGNKSGIVVERTGSGNKLRNIAAYDGKIYATDESGRLLRLDGVSLTTISASGAGTSRELHGIAGRLYVMQERGGGAKVRRWTGSAWNDQTGLIQTTRNGQRMVHDVKRNRLLIAGKGFIASTTASKISDAWTTVVDMGDVADQDVVGIGLDKDLEVVFMTAPSGATPWRLWRLVGGSTPTLINTFSEAEGQSVQPWNYVPRPMGGNVAAQNTTGPDMAFVDMITDLMTNTRYGAGIPGSMINTASVDAVRTACAAAGLVGSIIIESRTTALAAIEEILSHYAGWIAYVQNQFVFGIRQPESVTREVVIDDSLRDGEPTWSLPGERDTKNLVRINWLNRSQRYNPGPPGVASDDFDRGERGERAQNIDLRGYKVAEPVKKMAAKLLYMHSNPVTLVEVTMGPKELALAPGDVVALTFTKLGLTQAPARVLAVGESEDRSKFRVTFAEEPAASMLLAGYPIQSPNPGDARPAAYTDPGNTTPVIVELPEEMSGPSVRLAFLLSGPSTEWRGATVYVSEDLGTSYTKLDSYIGSPGIVGAVAATPLPEPNQNFGYFKQLDVNLSATRDPVLATTTTDGMFGTTNLAAVGDELITFREGALVSGTTYRLKGLFRGRFETAIADIVAGDRFGVYDPKFPTMELAAGYVGRVLMFKFASINQIGVEQSLAGLPAYVHVVRGAALQPDPPMQLQLEQSSVGLGSRRIISGAPTDVKVTWRYVHPSLGENADLVDGAETAAKEPDFMEYVVRVYTRDAVTDAWGLRRTVRQTTEGYTYTSAFNTADNGSFHNFLRFEVSARRTNGLESRRQRINVEVVA